MNITIISVGKLKEKYLLEGTAEYAKRLLPYATLRLVEIADEPDPKLSSPAAIDAVLQKEAEKIRARLKKDTYLIALVIKGKQFSSENFAEKLRELALDGKSDLAFLIGGSHGLHPELIKAADLHLSFSAFTFPHQLMRLILVEQIYRAFKIIKNEPYHK